MSYRDHKRCVPGWEGPVTIHSWQEFTARRLEWLYGRERAADIAAGRDPATNTDLAAWDRLGQRRAA